MIELRHTIDEQPFAILNHDEELSVLSKKRLLQKKKVTPKKENIKLGAMKGKTILATTKDVLLCVYCECRLTRENISRDHLIPLSKSGLNRKVNIVYCCTTCNNKKADLMLEKFLFEIDRQIKILGERLKNESHRWYLQPKLEYYLRIQKNIPGLIEYVKQYRDKIIKAPV